MSKNLNPPKKIKIDHATREYVLQAVYLLASNDPGSVPAIIETATEGVKAFAAEQTDKVAHTRTMLMDVLCSSNARYVRMKSWTLKDAIEDLRPLYGGTVSYENLKKKYLKDENN